MGYGLNSFLDHHDPVQILARLLVGSEGTLAFLASITMLDPGYGETSFGPVGGVFVIGVGMYLDLFASTPVLPEMPGIPGLG